MDDLTLFNWRVPAPVAGSQPTVYRALESIVRERIVPALRDPVVQEHAVAYYVTKRVPGADLLGSLAVTVIAPVGAEPSLMRVLGNLDAAGTSYADEPALHPMFADYRRGLREVTDIALELHSTADDAFAAHQCFLITLACSRMDPRFSLHPFLVEHTKVYATRSGLGRHGEGWSWEHENFWARAYTPGPDREIGAPLSLLWNIVLGVNPRPWDNPPGVAARLGITCS